MQITITRSKLYRRAGRFAWQWNYTIDIPGCINSNQGNSLIAGMAWLKRYLKQNNITDYEIVKKF